MTEMSAQDIADLEAKLNELWADPVERNRLIVLPSETFELMVLIDACDGYNCFEGPEHECGEVLGLYRDTEQAQRHLKWYEAAGGTARLEHSRTRDRAAEPEMIGEKSTWLNVFTGDMLDQEWLTWPSFEARQDPPTEVRWNWKDVLVTTTFRLSDPAAERVHEAKVNELIDKIRALVDSGYEPTNGPDLAEKLGFE